MRRDVRVFAVLFLACGWALVAAAAGLGGADGETNIALIGGGVLLAFGLIGGTTKWVAEPAIARAFADHMRNGAEAHKDLVPRNEWIALNNKLEEVHSDLRILTTQVRSVCKAMEQQP